MSFLRRNAAGQSALIEFAVVSGGTFALLKDFLPLKNNITTTFVPISDLSAVEKAIRSNTKVDTLPYG